MYKGKSRSGSLSVWLQRVTKGQPRINIHMLDTKPLFEQSMVYSQLDLHENIIT